MSDRSSDTQPPDDAKDRADLVKHAEAASDATWGDADTPKGIVPGVITGDVGPKGRVSAQLRDLSRTERSQYGEVPSGMNVPGTGRFVLLPVILVPVVLLLVIIALGWWLAR